jgi:hypothetical protein
VAVALCACREEPEDVLPEDVLPEDVLPEDVRTVCAPETGSVLTVRWTDRYLLPEGGVELANGDAPTVRTEGGSGYTPLQGQAVAPGRMVFESVPRAPVLICRGVACVYTCQRDVDLGQDFFGRPFPGWNQTGKGVGLTLDSLEPWSNGSDRLQVSVPNLRYTAPMRVYPPDGASTASFSVATGSPDLGSRLNVTPIPELSAARGDTLVVQQVRTRSLDVLDEEGVPVSFQYSTGVRAGQVSSYPESYSQSNLSMQPPPWATASFSVAAGPLAALLPELGPEVVPEKLWGYVLAARRQEHTLAWQHDVPLLSVQGSRWVVPEGQTFSYGLTSVEPARVLEVYATARSSNYLYRPSVGWRRELKEGVSEVLRPELGPVNDLRLNGLPDDRPNPRSRPLVLSWDAPSTGEPHQYEVHVYHSDSRDARPLQVLRLVTTERAVLIPSEALPFTSDKPFRCIVRSVYRPGSDPEQHPLRESVPTSWVDRVSADIHLQ